MHTLAQGFRTDARQDGRRTWRDKRVDGRPERLTNAQTERRTEKRTDGLTETGTDGSDWRERVGNADAQKNEQWAGRTNARSE